MAARARSSVCWYGRRYGHIARRIWIMSPARATSERPAGSCHQLRGMGRSSARRFAANTERTSSTCASSAGLAGLPPGGYSSSPSNSPTATSIAALSCAASWVLQSRSPRGALAVLARQPVRLVHHGEQRMRVEHALQQRRTRTSRAHDEQVWVRAGRHARRFGLASGALNAPSPSRDISVSDVSLDADVLVGPRYRNDSQAAWIPVRRRGHVTAHRPADAGSGWAMLPGVSGPSP